MIVIIPKISVGGRKIKGKDTVIIEGFSGDCFKIDSGFYIGKRGGIYSELYNFIQNIKNNFYIKNREAE